MGPVVTYDEFGISLVGPVCFISVSPACSMDCISGRAAAAPQPTIKVQSKRGVIRRYPSNVTKERRKQYGCKTILMVVNQSFGMIRGSLTIYYAPIGGYYAPIDG